MSGELSTLLQARTVLATLAETCSPLPWKAEGHDVYYLEGGATILSPLDDYPRGDNSPVENAMLVEVLSRTVHAQLWVIHCAIIAKEKNVRSIADDGTIQAGVTLAEAILGTQHEANAKLRERIMREHRHG